MAAYRAKFFRTAHYRVAQVYLRFAKHALEGSQLLPLLTLDRFRRALFLVEMAFRWLGYAQHSGALPSLLSRPSSDAPSAPVFPELHNKPGSGKSGLSMAFKRIMERAGIAAGVIRERRGIAGRSVSALSFHSLRHSFNSALANAGVPQELRMKLTGHSSTDMNTVYSHHEFERIRAAVRTIGRLPKN